MHPTITHALLLALAALVAGTVDAIAGGGGLITVPALFFVLPADATRLALGTNKGQSIFGSGSALSRYAHAGHVDRKRALPAFLLGLVGAVCGAQLTLLIPPEKLRPVVLVMLSGVAIYLTFRRAPRTDKPHKRRPIVAAAAAFLIGGYDGFLGPGTGTFLIISFVALLGDSMARASANAKVVNFASNLGALVRYTLAGSVLWAFALPMMAGQIIGGQLGAHFAVRIGDQLVRRVVLLVSLTLSVKLAIDILR